MRSARRNLQPWLGPPKRGGGSEPESSLCTVLIWTQSGRNAELLHTFDAPVWRVSWSVTGHMLAMSSGDSDVTLWKAGLDGTWTQMSTVEDALTEQ